MYVAGARSPSSGTCSPSGRSDVGKSFDGPYFATLWVLVANGFGWSALEYLLSEFDDVSTSCLA